MACKHLKHARPAPPPRRQFFELLYAVLIDVLDEAFSRLSKRPDIEREVCVGGFGCYGLCFRFGLRVLCQAGVPLQVHGRLACPGAWVAGEGGRSLCATLWHTHTHARTHTHTVADTRCCCFCRRGAGVTWGGVKGQLGVLQSATCHAAPTLPSKAQGAPPFGGPTLGRGLPNPGSHLRLPPSPSSAFQIGAIFRSKHFNLYKRRNAPAR